MKYNYRNILLIIISIFAIPLSVYASFAPASLAGYVSTLFQYFAGILFLVFLLLVARIVLRRNDPVKKVGRVGIIFVIIMGTGTLLSVGVSY